LQRIAGGTLPGAIRFAALPAARNPIHKPLNLLVKQASVKK
jgi:hypothetical protein